MKIFIIVFCLITAIPTYAMNLMGRLGVGMSEHSASGQQSISIKLQRSRSTALGGYFGFNSVAGKSNYNVGAKLYRIIYDEPALNFYSMAALGLFTMQNESDDTQSGYEFATGFGTEFVLQGIESLGFSFEFGLGYNNANGDTNFGTHGHNILKAAIHFYL